MYFEVILAYKVVRVNLAKPVDLSAACTLARLLGRTIGGMISRTTQKSPVCRKSLWVTALKLVVDYCLG